jgi:hypothetical protein
VNDKTPTTREEEGVLKCDRHRGTLTFMRERRHTLTR